MLVTKIEARKIRLQTNYTLHEFLEGSNMPQQAIDMNYEQLTVEQLCKIGMIAFELQKVRDRAKARFGDRLRGLRIVAGLRQKMWELLRDRSGNSEHVEGWAVDVQPICDDEDYAEIFDWIFNDNKDWFGGLAKANYNIGKKVAIKDKKYGFIHFDLRGIIARWVY